MVKVYEPEFKKQIAQLYLEHKGVIGYRMMYRLLVQQGIIKLNEYF